MLEAERHDPERVKRWVVLVDGAETQLDLVEAGAAAYGVDVTMVLDIIHVVEYVWKAAHVFHREGNPMDSLWTADEKEPHPTESTAQLDPHPQFREQRTFLAKLHRLFAQPSRTSQRAPAPSRARPA